MESKAYFLLALALAVNLVLVSATSDDDPMITISAVLGHSVMFRCPGNHSIPAHGLYVQKPRNGQDSLFINGFFNDNKMPVLSEYQSRTKVNKAELSMEMRNITVSDEGLYECVIFNSGGRPKCRIYLKVTANFSVHLLTPKCKEGNPEDGAKKGQSCQLSCTADGGYPPSDVRWMGLNPNLISVLHNNTTEHPISQTRNVSQSINYTCEQPINVSCAVGGAVSRTITICEKKSFPLNVIAAIVIVAIFVLIIIIVVMVKLCCRRTQIFHSGDQANGADVPLADCRSQLESV